MILLNDCIMGTFTNRESFLPRLQESITKYLPDIPFIVVHHKGSVNTGMTLLQKKFRESKKRFVIYCDDDIVFLNCDIIKNALEFLVASHFAAVTCYMTYDESVLTSSYDNSNLQSHITSVLVGYFMLIDTFRVGHIVPDLNLPFGHISVDTQFGLEIQCDGWEIGISKDYVWHQHKEDKNTQDMYLKTNAYLENKWGQVFKDFVKYGGNMINLPKGASE
jgi:hypothetical protein